MNGVPDTQDVRLKVKQTLRQSCRSPEEIVSLRIPGVYFLFDGDRLVYVGQSTHVPARIEDHLREGRIPFDRATFLPVEPEKLRERESYYIDLLDPEYNRTGQFARDRRYYEKIENEWFVEGLDDIFETDEPDPIGHT